MAYFLRKIILAKTKYKNHYNKLLTIIKAFKTWQYYLKDYKYKDFILTDYKKFFKFMNRNSLSTYNIY